MLNFLNLRIMKAKNLLKILFSLVAFLMVSSAFSQTYPGNLDQATTGDVDSVTADVTVPYYVEPDPVLNPSYTGSYPGGSGSLNADADWSWWIGTTLGPGGTVNSQGNAGGDPDTDGPYIQMSWNAPSVTNTPEYDSLYVSESNDNIACNGDTSSLRVLVFAQPGFTPVDADNDLIQICGSQDYPVQLAQILDNGLDVGDLKIRLDSVAVSNVDPANPQTDQGSLVRAAEDTVAVIPTPLGTGNTDIELFTYYMGLKNNDVTRYRFRFDGDGGISDQISRKSDYLAVGGSDPADDQTANWTYYPATINAEGPSIDVVVYPQPNTGNIYYVPSDFDQ